VAKTHRLPGRAARGGALAPEPAARHRCRTTGRVPRDFSEPSFPLFCPLFLKSDVSSFWDRTWIQFNVRFEIRRLILGDVWFWVGLLNKTLEADVRSANPRLVATSDSRWHVWDVRSRGKNGTWRSRMHRAIRRGSGPTPVAQAPPLAERPVAVHFPQKSTH